MSATGELLYDKLHEQKQNVEYTSRLPPASAMTLPLHTNYSMRTENESFNSERKQNEAKIVCTL